MLTIETAAGTDPFDGLSEAAGTVRDEAEAFREAFDEAVAAAALGCKVLFCVGRYGKRCS